MAFSNLGFLLQKLNKDSIIRSVELRGNFVERSIVEDIIGNDIWGHLNDDEKITLISKVNRIKFEQKIKSR